MTDTNDTYFFPISWSSKSRKNVIGIRNAIAVLLGTLLLPVEVGANSAASVEPQAIIQSPAQIAPQNIDKALRVDSSEQAKSEKPKQRERLLQTTVNTKYQKSLISYIRQGYRASEATATKIVKEAILAGRRHKIDPLLILAVIAVESSFKVQAQSGAGAQGLMQVHTRVHMDKFKEHGGADKAFDPAANIDVGTRILKDYLTQSGSVANALKWYVGARYSKSDGGYANKVLKERDRLELATRGDVALAIKMLRNRLARPQEAQSEKKGLM